MPSAKPIRLRFELPTPANRQSSHWGARHGGKKRYQKAAWLTAVQQQVPPTDPPQRVHIRATYYVWNRYDEDNATAGLKWVLDALRQRQQGKLTWRQGLYTLRGYFVDDSPAHAEIATPEQVVERGPNRDPRLDLEIVPLDTPAAR